MLKRLQSRTLIPTQVFARDMCAEGGTIINVSSMNAFRPLTRIPAQIAGYAATLLVGVTIVMLSVQLYADIRPILTQQTDVFRNHAVTLNKTVSTLSNLNRESLYFDDDEIAAIQGQPFVKNVARFRSSSFEAYASIALGQQALRTDLFFESIPEDYIDVRSDQWHWTTDSTFVPIIIPEDYLNLYNFGFAESQALPVISQSAIEQVAFTLRLTGHRRFLRQNQHHPRPRKFSPLGQPRIWRGQRRKHLPTSRRVLRRLGPPHPDLHRGPRL